MKNYTIYNQKPQNRFIDRINLFMLGSIIAVGTVSAIQGCTSTGGAAVPSLTQKQSVIVECKAASQAVDAGYANIPRMTSAQINAFNAAVTTIEPLCLSQDIPTASAQQADLLSGAVFTLVNLNKSLVGASVK